MNKIVSDAKDSSVQIIALSYNNLGMKHQVCTWLVKRHLSRQWQNDIHIFVKSNLIDCSTQY